jgi:hypothetical protein
MANEMEPEILQIHQGSLFSASSLFAGLLHLHIKGHRLERLRQTVKRFVQPGHI